jgi:hypothetical protein
LSDRNVLSELSVGMQRSTIVIHHLLAGGEWSKESLKIVTVSLISANSLSKVRYIVIILFTFFFGMVRISGCCHNVELRYIRLSKYCDMV